MPVVIIPIEVTGKYSPGFHFGNNSTGYFFRRQKPAQEGAAIAFCVGYPPETYFGYGRQYLLQYRVIFFLGGQKTIESANLRQPDCGMQFTDAEIIADKGMKVGAAVDSFVVVTVIAVTIAVDINIFPVRHYHTAFGAGHGFDKVETKGSGIADGTQLFAFVGAADALAGVFKQEQVVLFANGLKRLHIGHAAAHVYRHDAFCFGGYRFSYRPGIKGKRIIHIYKNRNGTNA